MHVCVIIVHVLQGRTLILNAEACGSHKIADELQAHGAGDGELYKRVNVVQLLQDGADIKSKDEDVSGQGAVRASCVVLRDCIYYV